MKTCIQLCLCYKWPAEKRLTAERQKVQKIYYFSVRHGLSQKTNKTILSCRCCKLFVCQNVLILTSFSAKMSHSISLPTETAEWKQPLPFINCEERTTTELNILREANRSLEQTEWASGDTAVRKQKWSKPTVNHGQTRRTTQRTRWREQLPVEGNSTTGKDKGLSYVVGALGKEGWWIIFALTSCSATSLFHGCQNECQRGARNSTSTCDLWPSAAVSHQLAVRWASQGGRQKSQIC